MHSRGKEHKSFFFYENHLDDVVPLCYNAYLYWYGRILRSFMEGTVNCLITQLQTEHKVVGVKQSRKAVQRGEAQLVFLALDADPQVTDPILELCQVTQVPVETVPHMKDLGAACGITLGCAVAAVLAE